MGRSDISQEPRPTSREDATDNRELAEVLDQALSQLNRGDDLEHVLARYPMHAGALRPMLRAARRVRRVRPPRPDPVAKQAGLDRVVRAARAQRDARVTAALDEAVTRVLAGEAAEAVVADYPGCADTLRPMLEAAVAVSTTPQPVPSEEAYFAGRHRLVKLAARRQRVAREGRAAAEAPGTAKLGTAKLASPDGAARLTGRLSRLLGVGSRLRRAAITAVLLVLMVLGSFSVTQVAADSLPTSPLYPVKRFTERVQLAFTPSSAAKAELHQRFSQARFQEARALARQTGKVDSQLVTDMLAQNDQFLGEVRGVAPERRQELVDDGARLFDQQRQWLRDFVDQVSDDPALAEAVERDLAALMPATPTPAVPATSTPEPSPTPTPAKLQATTSPAVVPATATPVPATATPTPEEVVVPEPPQEEPAATEPAISVPEPATAMPTPTATPEPVNTSPPTEATPTRELEATPTPAETEVVEGEATPTSTLPEIGLPTPPPSTPVP